MRYKYKVGERRKSSRQIKPEYAHKLYHTVKPLKTPLASVPGTGSKKYFKLKEKGEIK